MGEVIQFRKVKVSERHKGHTLCRSNFHKWEIIQNKQFDVRQGKLITVSQCKRCGKKKTQVL